MTGPPGSGSGQPWWQKPGGAPTPGRPPGYPPPQRPPTAPPQPPRHYGPPPQAPTQHAPAAPPRREAPPSQPPWQQAPQAPAPASPPRAKQKDSQLATIAGAVVAVVLFGGLALVGGLWFSGYFGGGSGTVLDVGRAEAGVQQILSDPINGYGANNVTDVECNGGKNPQVEAGKGFSCEVAINGAQRRVQVVFRDDAGTYEVDGPR